MDPRFTDPHAVLAFGREKLARKNLIFSAVCAGVGLLSVLVGGDDTMLVVVGWGLLVFGVGWAGWEFARTTQAQKPLLVLSPEGLRIHLDGVKTFLVPWTEVRGVDSVTVEGLRGATFDNVTVVLVDREFYDRVIHVDSFFWRGPGWGQFFIPDGDRVQVALHHAFLPVEAADLLAAVDARYRAFGRSG